MSWDRILYPLDLIGCNLLGRHFVGAFNVNDVLDVGRDLKRQGFGVTYNLLGEHVTDDKDVRMAVRTTIDLISKMDNSSLGNVSCKPTLYGLNISRETCFTNLSILVRLAVEKDIEIEIDAESSHYIRDTFEIFSRLASKGYNQYVRQAVQAHLKETFSLMDDFNMWDKNLRIVKGSDVYQEDESMIVKDPLAVRERYLEILVRNIKNGRRPFAATVRDIDLARKVIEISAKEKGQFEFQTLYGPVGKRMRRCLLSEGHPVRIYSPFTDTWCKDAWRPYSMRRTRINTMRKMILGEFLNYLKFFSRR